MESPKGQVDNVNELHSVPVYMLA